MTIERTREAYDLYPDLVWQRLIGGAQARLEYVITTHVLGVSNHILAVAHSTSSGMVDQQGSRAP